MGDVYHNPVSDESLALMKGWIDECQRGHQLCRTTPQQIDGLKRLLQYLPDDGSVRLVETQSRSQRCDYIALSYCWGDGKAVKKTTEKTLGEHQRGISDESLPQLFQEVVALARRLNIAHLWIDSLCIIQDSDKYKVEKIKQMNDIFRRALVVVVAATAKSPLDSLLRVKPQDQSHTWRTARLLRYQEMDLDVKSRKRPEKAHSWTDATYDTPITERAWCFQEKLLASRYLVFCEDEVVWECQSHCLCECGGEQEHFSDEVRMTRYQKMLLPLAEHEPLQLDGTLRYFADAETAYSFWETAVENYSRRALTLRTDTLAAISAVASTVAEATGDRYLAGLWIDKLLAGLCWFPWVPVSHFDQGYTAPTWSWASYPGWIQYTPSYRTRDWRDADDQATVINAGTNLKGPDQHGPVSDGAIVLSGVHCDVEMTLSEWVQLDFGHGEVQSFLHMRATHCLDHMCVEPDTEVNQLGGSPQYLRRLTDLPEYMQPDCAGTVHLLWLHQEVTLILTPPRRRKGTYERLGIFMKKEYHVLGESFPKMPKMVERSSITLV